MRFSIFKAIAASALAAMAASSTASAADLAARPYTKAPVTEPIYHWTGFYIGGNVGYSWATVSDTSTLQIAGAVLFTSADRADMDGVIGGQIGYNWQVQNWVWGLEADIQGSDQKGRRDFLCATSVCTPPFGVIAVFPGPAVPVALDQKLDGSAPFVAGSARSQPRKCCSMPPAVLPMAKSIPQLRSVRAPLDLMPTIPGLATPSALASKA